MAVGDNLQVEYNVNVPLQLTANKAGLPLAAAITASVPVLLNANGSDIISFFNEGPYPVWFQIFDNTAARAVIGGEAILPGNKEVFVLPPLPNYQLGQRNYISVITRGGTSNCTVNTYLRGT